MVKLEFCNVEKEIFAVLYLQPLGHPYSLVIDWTVCFTLIDRTAEQLSGSTEAEPVDRQTAGLRARQVERSDEATRLSSGYTSSVSKYQTPSKNRPAAPPSAAAPPAVTWWQYSRPKTFYF